MVFVRVKYWITITTEHIQLLCIAQYLLALKDSSELGYDYIQ